MTTQESPMNVRNLGIISISALLFLCVTAVVSPTYGQQTTEQFIPIGKSPGISEKYSYTGAIVAIDRAARTISVEDNGEIRIIKVTTETSIWLDRSKIKRQNQLGGYDDCEVGRRIEVKYTELDKNVAEWIKIEST